MLVDGAKGACTHVCVCVPVLPWLRACHPLRLPGPACTHASPPVCLSAVCVRAGIEPQTRKLFAVARMRKLPIFTFVNKVRRGPSGRGPADRVLCVQGAHTHSAVGWPDRHRAGRSALGGCAHTRVCVHVRATQPIHSTLGNTQMDRPALNGFEIVEQLEKEFGLQSFPINWCVAARAGCVPHAGAAGCVGPVAAQPRARSHVHAGTQSHRPACATCARTSVPCPPTLTPAPPARSLPQAHWFWRPVLWCVPPAHAEGGGLRAHGQGQGGAGCGGRAAPAACANAGAACTMPTHAPWWRCCTAAAPWLRAAPPCRALPHAARPARRRRRRRPLCMTPCH